MVNELNDPTLEELEPRILRLWMLNAMQRLKPGSVRYRLSFLRGALEYALREGLLLENVANAVKGPPGETWRFRYLSPDEETMLSGSMTGDDFSVVRFAILTGCRRGEIFHTKPEHVDWLNRTLLIPDSKTGASRVIPLHPDAFVIACRWRSETWGQPFLVVPSLNPSRRWKAADKWASRRFRPACRRAGIVDFHFHDLRHTFASRLVQAGVSLYHVQVLLGHKSPAMTQRYAHLNMEHLVQAVYRLN